MNARVQNDVLLQAADTTAENRYFSSLPTVAGAGVRLQVHRFPWRPRGPFWPLPACS